METKNETQPPRRRKTKQKKKTRWVTLLQWTRHTKTIRDHEETKGTTKKNLHVCFGAVGLQPFLVFCVFCLLQKHCFSPENGLFCSFLSVSLFSPWFFHVSFFTLCLSLFCFLFFLFFSLLSCWLSPSLFFCCFCLPCFFVFVSRRKLYIWKVSFHQLFLFFLVSCFVFQNPFLNFVFSFFQLCVLVNINVFIFQRRPFLKHPVLFCALCKVIIFVKGRFWGQIWLMFEKHCKNKHFSTGLRTWSSELVRFSRVEGSGLRLFCGPGERKPEGAGPKAEHVKQKFQMLGFSVFWSCFLVTGAGPLKWLM